MFRQIPITLMPSDHEFLEKPAKTVMLLPALPSSFLDDLFSGNLIEEERRKREDYVLDKISHFEEVLRILNSSKLSDSAKKQFYELILANNEYVIADFCWALFNCSVASLKNYQTEIINFFTKKCKFSNSISNYLFNCFIKKHPLQIDIQDEDNVFQVQHHFLGSTMSSGNSHIPLPLQEPKGAYGRNLKRNSFVKYMLIYHFFRFQCHATGIARMLQEFHIDLDSTDTKIRSIKSGKRKQYNQNLDYLLTDLENVFTSGFIYRSTHEWMEVSVSNGQFRIKPNNT